MIAHETVLFSWLHVSDLHFGHGSAQHRSDQRLVLDQLRMDVVSTRNDENIKNLRYIFVTGDIAFSGDARLGRSNAASEYETATQWLTSLAESIGLSPQQVFMVPGNHDIQRDANKTGGFKRLLARLRSGDEFLDGVLVDSADTELLASRLQNYLAFATAFGPPQADETQARELHWSRRVSVTTGVHVKIVGLNTSLLAEGDDRGRLAVGKAQLEHLSENDQSHLTIVLSHHPFDWLADGTDVQRWVRAHAHIHLCGHVHDAESEHARRGGGTDCITVAAGAAHNEEGSFSHGYSLASIILKSDGTLALRIWPRLWSDKNKDFRLDRDNVERGRSYAEHSLRLTLPITPELTAAALTSPAIPNHHHNNDKPARITLTDIRVPVCDSPPTAEAWVGREGELDILADTTFRVVAITGIGGQGKSTLASKHIQMAQLIQWDWRDCREQDNTLHTHIVRLIERLSGGGIAGGELASETIDSVLQTLFRLVVADPTRWIFVFDNIDSYIDTVSCKPTGGMKKFFELALREPHNSQFVFTCRPSVTYDEPSFCQLSLAGLSVSETLRLFQLRGVDISSSVMKRQIADAQVLTQGHPLWLTLIATQIAKRISTIEDLLAGIRHGKGTSLPMNTLSAIWKTLNDNQQDLLRFMAELTRPASEEQLGRIVDKRLSYNRFNRALKVLKSVNLVVIKSSPNRKDTLELHPLVREFVRVRFKLPERTRFIDTIVEVLGSFVAPYRPKISDAPYDILEQWVTRAELQIASQKFADALKTISEVSAHLLASGYQEDFLRVAQSLFSEFNWTGSDLNDYPSFDEEFGSFVNLLCDLGRAVDADYFLNKYEGAIPGRNKRYCELCNLRCYYFWVLGDHEAAKQWGVRGVELKVRAGFESYNLEHNLALAQRDSGEIEPALRFFLDEHSLEVVLEMDEVTAGMSGAFFGNIGRCLWLSGQIDRALICYRKSAHVLEREADNDATLNLNRGWARLWIGEALERRGDYELACSFYQDAVRLWKTTSPPRASTAARAIQRLLETQSLQSASVSDISIESTCLNWILSKTSR